MLSNNPKITDLKYKNAVEQIAESKGISIEESRQEVMSMSFSDYMKAIVEASADITPPSGMKIGGNTQPQPQQQAKQTAPQQAGTGNVQVLWKGQGTPIEKGMTVGLKGQNNKQVPGQITQVDSASKGVKVKNPTTNQEEWYNNSQLEPYASQQQGPVQNQQQNQMGEELSRLKKLAGIAEDASGGASCAGAMGAGTPQPLGKMQKRNPVEEDSLDEYTPKVAKTVVGDTKPGQATGRLSARLAKAGKPTATRNNNGFKK